MKAVIVEIRGSHAAALTDDGCIIKVQNKNYVIGQVINVKKQVFRKPTKIVALASAAAAVVIMFGVTAWAYCTPYSYVSLDVNPSIEYSVNRFARVLSVEAVNGDGTKIIANLDLKNKTINEAVKATVQQIKKAGYFTTEDPGGIIIATSCENENNAQKLASDLQGSAEQAVEDTASEVEVEAVSVGYERVLEARTLGTTPGKLNLVEKLQASISSPDSLNVQEWLQKPVKEIMKAIKTEKQESKVADTGDDNTADSASSASTSSTVQSEASAEGTSSQTAGKTNASNQGQSKKTGNTVSKITGKSDAAENGNSGSKAAEDSTSKTTGKSDTIENDNDDSNTAGNSTSKTTGKSDTQENGNSGSKKAENSGKNKK